MRQSAAVPNLGRPPRGGTMTTISKDAKLVTFINVFTIEPANQQRLVDLLARFTDASVRHAPGFVSAALHRSLDGTKVTMYSQWRSIEDYQAMRKKRRHAAVLAGGAHDRQVRAGHVRGRRDVSPSI